MNLRRHQRRAWPTSSPLSARSQMERPEEAFLSPARIHTCIEHKPGGLSVLQPHPSGDQQRRAEGLDRSGLLGDVLTVGHVLGVEEEPRAFAQVSAQGGVQHDEVGDGLVVLDVGELSREIADQQGHLEGVRVSHRHSPHDLVARDIRHAVSLEGWILWEAPDR